MKKYLLTLILFAFVFVAFAQDSTLVREEETTGMRANEKIYVVVAVVGTILAGLFIYLIRLDKKIGRLEKGGR